MNPRPLAVLRGISKRYDSGTLAVRGVDLTIRDGDFIALLGPSGCGKSTLLRILAGLADPTAGDIDWPSTMHDVHGEPEREVGFVFQEPTLMPWSTALANVTLPLELAGMKRSQARERARDALRRVGLSGFEKAFPRALSGGMKMRVSIARALVSRPRLLLMDEPFAALDEITRFRLNNDLLELWQEEKFTVVFVTHSVFESVYLAQRIVVMAPRPGRVVADIVVDAAYPRGEEFRTSGEYAGHCREVSQRLSMAMA
jgi:NitT/TauT family transport system ATP-binding protein